MKKMIVFILSLLIWMFFYVQEGFTMIEDCKNIDKTTYEAINYSDYWKDKRGFYYKCNKLPVKDRKSFQVYRSNQLYWSNRFNFAKDARYVYSNGKILKGIDAKSFREIQISEFSIFTDKNNLFCDADRLTGIHGSKLKPIYSEIRTEDGEAYYTDWNKVIQWSMGHVDAHVSYNYSKGCKLLNWADPASWEYKHGYSTDKTNVYIGWDRLYGADPKSFRSFNDTIYGLWRDKNYFYVGLNRMDRVDVNSLIQIWEDGWSYFFKDKNSIYFLNHEKSILQEIPEADYTSFIYNHEKYYFEDKNSIFWPVWFGGYDRTIKASNK